MANLVLKYSIINGLILFCILLYRKKITVSSKYYLLLYITFIVTITEQLFISTLIARTWFTYSELPTRFLFSTFLFLYISTYLNPRYRPSQRVLLFLFLPSAIDALCCIIFSSYALVKDLNSWQKFELINSQTFYLTRTFSAIIFSLYWNIQGLKKINLFLKRVKNVYAGIDRQQLQWLTSTSLATVILWSIWLGYAIAECFYIIPRDSYLPLFMLMSILIVIQGYFVILKPYTAFQFIIASREIKEKRKEDIAVQEAENKNRQFINNKESWAVTEKRNGIKEYLVQLFDRIEDFMEEAKAYTNKDLSLSVLSEQLKEPQTNITKAITVIYNDSFYNYVNRFRAKKFLHLLSGDKSDLFTIETLSYMCGFSSRTTLYKYFKELTGLTPAAALKIIREKNTTVESLIIHKDVRHPLKTLAPVLKK